MNIKLQDPIITHMERTGWPMWYDELPIHFCIECGEEIDPYDLDAYIGEYDECMCGRCARKFYEMEDE